MTAAPVYTAPRTVVLLVAVGALLAWSACAELLQLQIVHRHGARPHLIKHATDPAREDTTGPSLYPGGIQQLAGLGDYVAQRYVAREWPRFSRRSVGAFSSNWQRTLLSSRAFLNSLADDGSLLTTAVSGDRDNDWRLRGYALCPRLVRRFEEFIDTDEYRDKRDDTQRTNETNRQFVERLAEPLQRLDALDAPDKTFEHVFNVYDRYLIRSEDFYGDESSPNQQDRDLPALSGDDFARLRSLADWYESAKFSFAVHNLHVAGGLVSAIVRHMTRAVESNRSRELVEYSAHYPTLLTLLASMGAGSPADGENPANRIPGFGAALLIEVWTDGSPEDAYVRLRWYPGDGQWREGSSEDFDRRITPLPLTRAPCDQEGGNACRATDFIRLMQEAVVDEDEFCDMCESEADFCEARLAGCSAGTKVISGAVGLVLGIVAGLGVAYLYAARVGRRKRRMFESASDEQGDMWAGDSGGSADRAGDVPASGTFGEVTP